MSQTDTYIQINVFRISIKTAAKSLSDDSIKYVFIFSIFTESSSSIFISNIYFGRVINTILNLLALAISSTRTISR